MCSAKSNTPAVADLDHAEMGMTERREVEAFIGRRDLTSLDCQIEANACDSGATVDDLPSRIPDAAKEPYTRCLNPMSCASRLTMSWLLSVVSTNG
jgi:hypothetical protein